MVAARGAACAHGRRTPASAANAAPPSATKPCAVTRTSSTATRGDLTMWRRLRRGDAAVAARRLRAVCGEVGAVHELLARPRILGRGGEPDRDGDAERIRCS